MEILRSEWGGSLAEVTQLGGRQAKTEPCLILAFSAIFCSGLSKIATTSKFLE